MILVSVCNVDFFIFLSSYTIGIWVCVREWVNVRLCKHLWAPWRCGEALQLFVMVLLYTHPPHECSPWHTLMVCWPHGMCRPWRRMYNWWRALGPWWSAAESPYWQPPHTPSPLGLKEKQKEEVGVEKIDRRKGERHKREEKKDRRSRKDTINTIYFILWLLVILLFLAEIHYR